MASRVFDDMLWVQGTQFKRATPKTLFLPALGSLHHLRDATNRLGITAHDIDDGNNDSDSDDVSQRRFSFPDGFVGEVRTNIVTRRRSEQVASRRGRRQPSAPPSRSPSRCTFSMTGSPSIPPDDCLPEQPKRKSSFPIMRTKGTVLHGRRRRASRSKSVDVGDNQTNANVVSGTAPNPPSNPEQAQRQAGRRISAAIQRQRQRDNELQRELEERERQYSLKVHERRSRVREERLLAALNAVPVAVVPAMPAVRPPVIHIVGGGPVGMFIAILLALKHGRLVNTIGKGGLKFYRMPGFPIIRVWERRPLKKWGRRNQTIAIQTNVQSLLSKIIPAPDNNFSPSCPINALERSFRPFLEQTLSVPVREGKIAGNRELLDQGADCIIWCGGKGSPSPVIRDLLGMQQRIGTRENALIFSFESARLKGVEGGDATAATSLEKLIDCVHLVAWGTQLRFLVRPANTANTSGRLWIIGLDSTLFERGINGDDAAGYVSMVSAWDNTQVAVTNAVGATKSRIDAARVAKSSAVEIRKLLVDMEERVGCIPCSMQKLVASHFRSERAVAYVEATSADGVSRHVPVVLAGDAAFGKPFYTGSTLNNHLQDANLLVAKTEWTKAALSDPSHRCLAAYEKNFLTRVSAPRFMNKTST